MGKPLKKCTSKSEHSLSCCSSKEKQSVSMSVSKTENMKKKRHNKTKKNIKKLFDELRNESCSTSTSEVSVNNTVIILDSPVTSSNKNVAGTSAANSKTNVQSPISNLKRKSSELNTPVKSKRSKISESLIVIKDDSDIVTSSEPCSSTPAKASTIQCSTPINKKDSKGLLDLITSSFPMSKNNNSIIHNLNEEIHELTKEIRKESYITIDLTTETVNGSTSKTQNTVIDLDNTAENNDCMVVSVSNTSLSMSGESDVTVLRAPTKSKTRQMKKVFSGLSKLDAAEKNKMLQYVVEQILTGCNVPESLKSSLTKLKKSDTATETVEDTYIKEVILGQAQSRNSIGSNIYNPERDAKNKCGLRMVVIDGSNVAMEHSKGRFFSVKGLKICIDYFVKRGHIVKAFVPRFRSSYYKISISFEVFKIIVCTPNIDVPSGRYVHRCKFGKSSDPRLLDDLERRGLVIYTPSREIQGRTITPYDDRYIVQCAAEFDGIIVSGDNYRDLLHENVRWRYVIENRLLQFTWVEDMIMFPRDPLGRNGPNLEQFLKHPNHNDFARK